MTTRGTKYWDNGAIPLIGPDVLGNIIAEVSDVGIVMTEGAEVLSVLVNPNLHAYKDLEKFEGHRFQESLEIESVAKFDERMARFVAGDDLVRPLELNHTDQAQKGNYPLRYSFHRIGPDGAVLLLGRDLRPVAEMQQQLVKAQLALERDYEVQREFDTRFRVVMESATDGFVFVSTQTGQITDLNPAAERLLGSNREELLSQDFSALFEPKGRGDLLNQLTAKTITQTDTVMEAQLRKQGTVLCLSPLMFRAAGERFMLCRMRQEDGSDTTIDALSETIQGLYATGPDGMAFTTEDGTLLSANDSFLELIGVAHDVNIKSRNLADFLLRGTIDVKVMTENTARAGRMRLYATKIAGDYGSPRNVEISVTRVTAGENTIFAFVIRDANRAEGQRPQPDVPNESISSVVELVGSATLKEIVAETTNVVEKMCIETAVELTMNNRVAAAEMLGLSRQSLYVKLRKFDLLSKDGDT